MTRFSSATGTAIATFAAGPIFILPWLVYGAARDGAEFGAPIAALLIGLVSVPVGAVLSILPNVIGTALLAALGARYRPFRHPLFWMLVGAATGATLGLIAGGVGPLAMGWTGAVCALLCRWRGRWDDDVRNEPTSGVHPPHVGHDAGGQDR